MVGWHHRLNEHEFEQAPGVGNGQGSLVCCSPWGHKESDTVECLNWTKLNWFLPGEFHGQRSHSPWHCRVGQDWATSTFTSLLNLNLAKGLTFFCLLYLQIYIFRILCTFFVYVYCMFDNINFTKAISQLSSVNQSCLTLWDPMDCSTPGLPVHHQLPEFTHPSNMLLEICGG